MPDAATTPVHIRKNTEPAVVQPSGTRWKPGQSGNISGRPPGTANRLHSELRAILLDDGAAVARMVTELAMGGDMAAAKLIFDRILPKRVCFSVSEAALPALKTAGDACDALGQIASAVLNGHLSPPDGAALAQIVEGFRRAVETLDHEQRLAELERLQEARNESPKPFPYRSP